MKNFDDPEWEKTRALLKEHLSVPPLEHPDFVNSRVLEEIGRAERKPRPAAPLFSLRWLSLAGSMAVLLAVVLTLFWVPRGGPTEQQFISQVVSARAAAPDLSVSQFEAPGQRGVVLWLDGTEYIPAGETVR